MLFHISALSRVRLHFLIDKHCISTRLRETREYPEGMLPVCLSRLHRKVARDGLALFACLTNCLNSHCTCLTALLHCVLYVCMYVFMHVWSACLHGKHMGKHTERHAQRDSDDDDGQKHDQNSREYVCVRHTGIVHNEEILT